MDVFSTVAAVGRGFLGDAAVHAAHELGLFAALAHADAAGEPSVARKGARTIDELSAALGIGARRLRALCDLLVLDGALIRSGAALACPSPPPRPRAPPSEGWGRLAEVLRAGRPLDEPDPAPFHRHLFAAGGAAARELASRFPLAAGQSLLDAGGGAGAYTAAFLDAAPGVSATLVDRAPVVALARAALSGRASSPRLVAGDLFDEATALGRGHAVGLLANVLHLHPPEACARLVARVAAAVAPGGEVVVKEIFVEPDRSGPASGLLFALNMALYTDGGDAYDPTQIAAWLTAAGLETPRISSLASAPDAVVVAARRPRDSGARPILDK